MWWMNANLFFTKQMKKKGESVYAGATLLYEWSCQEGKLCKLLRKWNSYLLNAHPLCVSCVIHEMYMTIPISSSCPIL